MAEEAIDISKFNKADVLAALYNRSKVQGLGWVQVTPGRMTHEEAAKLLESQTYFDYLHGKIMKVELAGNELNPGLYDRDNGTGAAQRAIDFVAQATAEAQG